jgi:hypothetical protein
MPAQPQDHKPAKGEPFKFTDSEGKSHALPSASKGRANLSGRDLRDALVNGEIGQMGYLVKALEAAEPNPEVLDALYAMPQSEVMDVLQAWGEHGDGDGASLGESKPSTT